MRQAIFEAEMGDDVSGEDPSANRLQEMAADMLGKEDALIVSSGTMGNLVASLAHCQRGDEMIVGDSRTSAGARPEGRRSSAESPSRRSWRTSTGGSTSTR